MGLYAVACYASVGESSISNAFVDYRPRAFDGLDNGGALELIKGLRGTGPRDDTVRVAILAVYGQ